MNFYFKILLYFQYLTAFAFDFETHYSEVKNWPDYFLYQFSYYELQRNMDEHRKNNKTINLHWMGQYPLMDRFDPSARLSVNYPFFGKWSITLIE